MTLAVGATRARAWAPRAYGCDRALPRRRSITQHRRPMHRLAEPDVYSAVWQLAAPLIVVGSLRTLCRSCLPPGVRRTVSVRRTRVCIHTSGCGIRAFTPSRGAVSAVRIAGFANWSRAWPGSSRTASCRTCAISDRASSAARCKIGPPTPSHRSTPTPRGQRHQVVQLRPCRSAPVGPWVVLRMVARKVGQSVRCGEPIRIRTLP